MPALALDRPALTASNPVSAPYATALRMREWIGDTWALITIPNRARETFRGVADHAVPGFWAGLSTSPYVAEVVRTAISESESARTWSHAVSAFRAEAIRTDTLRLIEEIRAFPEDWNGSDGKPAGTVEISKALQVVNRLAPMLERTPVLYPSPEGGVVCEVEKKGDRVTVLIEGDLMLIISYLLDNHEVKEYKIEGDVPQDALEWIEAAVAALLTAGIKKKA